mmetsp:Transcript_4336/g.17026  ORF Transcript_4336/g.17026 Transcript_4336/m.17026 type:complete len:579 (+) Transcript_4336:1206-2942(+)
MQLHLHGLVGLLHNDAEKALEFAFLDFHALAPHVLRFRLHSPGRLGKDVVDARLLSIGALAVESAFRGFRSENAAVLSPVLVVDEQLVAVDVQDRAAAPLLRTLLDLDLVPRAKGDPIRTEGMSSLAHVIHLAAQLLGAKLADAVRRVQDDHLLAKHLDDDSHLVVAERDEVVDFIPLEAIQSLCDLWGDLQLGDVHGHLPAVAHVADYAGHHLPFQHVDVNDRAGLAGVAAADHLHVVPGLDELGQLLRLKGDVHGDILVVGLDVDELRQRVDLGHRTHKVLKVAADGAHPISFRVHCHPKQLLIPLLFLDLLLVGIELKKLLDARLDVLVVHLRGHVDLLQQEPIAIIVVVLKVVKALLHGEDSHSLERSSLEQDPSPRILLDLGSTEETLRRPAAALLPLLDGVQANEAHVQARHKLHERLCAAFQHLQDLGKVALVDATLHADPPPVSEGLPRLSRDIQDLRHLIQRHQLDLPHVHIVDALESRLDLRLAAALDEDQLLGAGGHGRLDAEVVAQAALGHGLAHELHDDVLLLAALDADEEELRIQRRWQEELLRNLVLHDRVALLLHRVANPLR